MRTTVVPAQVITIEDRVTAKLSISQLILLITPIFCASILFVILPPFFNFSIYKIIVSTSTVVCCSILAVRHKDKLFLQWIMILIKYNQRPRHYIFNKNDLYFQKEQTKEQILPIDKVINRTTQDLEKTNLTIAEIVRTETVLNNPNIDLRIESNNKGELRVFITKI